VLLALSLLSLIPSKYSYSSIEKESFRKVIEKGVFLIGSGEIFSFALQKNLIWCFIKLVMEGVVLFLSFCLKEIIYGISGVIKETI
jgi:hypothetical protein